MDCRRVRLLGYGGEIYKGGATTCGGCDNCMEPPAVWDGTDAARKLLSCIYRVHQASGITFGAGHIIDILRGKSTEKVTRFNHQSLTTFGIGAEFSETQLRSVLRQLVATGAVAVDSEAYDTLRLTDASREVLRGERAVRLRETSPAKGERKARGGKGREKTRATTPQGAPLDGIALERFSALKAWRADVAREHNLPAYVIFHDATLAAIAERAPQTLEDLQGISGIGARKLEAYGEAVLEVTTQA
jgi:ATP-dependent DNA helicase RecQ